MILKELTDRVHRECNSNFHFSSLDWSVRVWLQRLCDIIDEKLAEKEDIISSKKEAEQ